MPAQATISSKTLNYHRWAKQDISWQNQIYIIFFNRSSPTKDNRWKTPIQGWKLHPRKSEKIIFQQTQKIATQNIILSLTTKITGSNNHFSLISRNINGLNSPIKRHRLTAWIWKQDPAFCCLPETHLSVKDKHYLRVKGWKKNSKQMVPRNKLE